MLAPGYILKYPSAPDPQKHSLGDHFESDEEAVDILCRVSDLVVLENSHDENEEEISSLSLCKFLEIFKIHLGDVSLTISMVFAEFKSPTAMHLLRISNVDFVMQCCY